MQLTFSADVAVELCVVNNFQISDACPSIFIGNGFALGSVKLHKTHISHTADTYTKFKINKQGNGKCSAEF